MLFETRAILVATCLSVLQFPAYAGLNETKTDTKKHFQALNGLGIVYRDNNDYSNSLKYLHEILDKCKSLQKNNFIRYTGQAYHGIALINVRQQNFEEAIVNFKKSIEIDVTVNDENSRNRFVSLQSLGELYAELGQLKAARSRLLHLLRLQPNHRQGRDLLSRVDQALAQQRDCLRACPWRVTVAQGAFAQRRGDHGERHQDRIVDRVADGLHDHRLP